MEASSDDLRRTRSGREFGQTVGSGVGSDAKTEPASAQAPVSDRRGIAEQLQRLGYAVPQRPRITVTEALGMGATGRVYAAHDAELDRPIAIKVLATDSAPSPAAVAGFLNEARITASLEHPNVLPVHEIEVNAQGQVFFTMKRVDGRSLGATLEESTASRRLAPLDDTNALVSAFIGVGQALAYAHRRRVIHQDVKPDNIMLGGFGEVLLVDWGSARRLDEAGGELYGTPLYMSPEQARGEPADERSDVYCLGATFFHALMLRLPVWREDVDDFWDAKRSGEIDRPTAAEAAAVPPPLLAIALKALEADPSARYTDAAGLVEDLRGYQAGLAVSALRESLLQRARRWHRHHARSFWSWTVAALLVVALAGALYGERLAQMARWGAPHEESFSDGSWQQRWAMIRGRFRSVDGRLISEELDNSMVLRQPLQGATAIEFEGEVQPGHPLGDISLLWSRTLEFAEDGTPRLGEGFAIQIGAWDGAFSCITVGLVDREIVAQSSFRPESGRRFRARVEIEDNRIRILVDGREICAWSDPFPVEGGHLALFAARSGKAYGDLRIFRREVPARVPATAIGDEAARAGVYDLAAASYARIAASHAGSDLGDEAAYKQGLCRWRQGRQGEALAIWDGVGAGTYAARIRIHRLEAAFDRGSHEVVLAGVAELHGRSDAPIRDLIAMQWGRWTDRIRALDQRPLLERFLALHDACLADHAVADHSAAQALYHLGRGDELLRRFPGQRHLCARVLHARGDYGRVIAEYPDQHWQRTASAYYSGTWDAMDPDSGRGLMPETLWLRGRAEEVIRDPGISPVTRSHAFHSLGRFEEALAQLASPGAELTDVAKRDAIRSLIALGRHVEAAAISDEGRRLAAIATGDVGWMLVGEGDGWRPWAEAIAAIQARAAGDGAPARTLAPQPVTDPYTAYSAIVDAQLLVPLIVGLDGGGFAAFDAACADLAGRLRWINQQRLGLIAGHVLGTRSEADVRGAPCVVWAAADAALAVALRAERHGERAVALAAWRAYAAIPEHLQAEEIDAGRRTFSRWRIAELERATR